MLMAGEAAVESKRSLGLRSVPSSVAHAVAPGVEMGLLHDGLVLPHHLVPAAQVVGEDVVEITDTVLRQGGPVKWVAGKTSYIVLHFVLSLSMAPSITLSGSN